MNPKTQRQKEIRAIRLSQGLCQDGCGKPIVIGKKYCSKCLELKSKHRADLVSQGLCQEGCGRPTNPKNSRCKICLLKSIAKKSTGNVNNAKELGIKLVAQNYRCPYTGAYIHVGENASIDHIIPRSKGGTNKPDNLEWVHIAINTLKGDMRKEEFVEYFDKFLTDAFHFRGGKT